MSHLPSINSQNAHLTIVQFLRLVRVRISEVLTIRRASIGDKIDSRTSVAATPKDPVRVLQVVTIMNRAGLETMLMNYYRAIDRTKVQFDFLVHRAEKGDYDDEIKKLGGRIYRFDPITIKSIPGYAHRMKNFLLSHPEYKIIHSHLDALSMLPLKGAKKAGTPTRIAHSHNNGFSKDAKLPLRYFYKSKLKKYATHFFACSNEAGRFMFGKGVDFHILRNAINLSEYTFDREKRARLRADLGIREDEFVIGHVGRLTDQKNQEFLLRVLHMTKDKKSGTKLILIGEGENRATLQDIANVLNISDRVLFLGSRPDVSSLLNTLDVFALPSKYEGLGIAAIEAQVNGLPAILSTNTSTEAALSDLVEYLPINDGCSVSIWSKSIIRSRRQNDKDRASVIENAISLGYDINREVDSLVGFYGSK